MWYGKETITKFEIGIIMKYRCQIVAKKNEKYFMQHDIEKPFPGKQTE